MLIELNTGISGLNYIYQNINDCGLSFIFKKNMKDEYGRQYVITYNITDEQCKKITIKPYTYFKILNNIFLCTIFNDVDSNTYISKKKIQIIKLYQNLKL